MEQAQTFGKGLGNQCRLIVSAFPLALLVERNGHDDIGRESVALRLDNFQEPLRKPPTQRLDLLELQQENGPNQRSLINREAANAIKAVGFVLARGTKPGLLFLLLQSKKRAATDFANSCRDPVERSETLRADGHAPGIHEQFAANAAISGKNYADQRVARRRKPRAQTFLKPRLFCLGASERSRWCWMGLLPPRKGIYTLRAF